MPTASIVYKKSVSTTPWVHEPLPSGKDFKMVSISDIASFINSKFNDKLKEECGTITVKLTQCVPVVTIEGDCTIDKKDEKKEKFKSELLEHSSGIFSENRTHFDDKIFKEKLKHGMSIDITYAFADCTVIAPVVKKDCDYSAYVKVEFDGDCFDKDAELTPIHGRLTDYLQGLLPDKTFSTRISGTEHIFKIKKIERPTGGDVPESKKIKRGFGISLRKNSTNKKNLKKKKLIKRFSRC